MELQDGSFELLSDVVTTSDAEVAFGDADLALLVGSKPRGPGMERADLIRENGPIFIGQGKAIDAAANPNVKVVVVGNPCNTNCLIAQNQATRVNPRNFTAMTRLDQNRAESQLAIKAGCAVSDINRLAIWGNHSPTMYPDYTNALIGDAPLMDVITDHEWLDGPFIKTCSSVGGRSLTLAAFCSVCCGAAIKTRTGLAPRQTANGSAWRLQATAVTESLRASFSFPCRADADDARRLSKVLN